MKNSKNIGTAIRNAKNKLINSAKKKGIYENFGEKEYRKIRDDFISPTNTEADIKAKAEFQTFYDWCLDYNG